MFSGKAKSLPQWVATERYFHFKATLPNNRLGCRGFLASNTLAFCLNYQSNDFFTTVPSRHQLRRAKIRKKLKKFEKYSFFDLNFLVKPDPGKY
jgi:hypothetical protein